MTKPFSFPPYIYRWLYSTNARDIGVLYLIFAAFSGMLGTAFSLIIRFELSQPDFQFLQGNYQLYNVVITAHALLMIFFLVKHIITKPEVSFKKPFPILYKQKIKKTSLLKEIDFSGKRLFSSKITTLRGEKPEDLGEVTVEKSHGDYKKVIIKDPYNNRKLILALCKGEKGVYVWFLADGSSYVGHSINLYNRVNSYFMPSILATKARKVLKHFFNSGFKDVILTLYIMDKTESLESVVSLEQYFIDSLKPNLNVNLIAKSAGYHEPMSMETRLALRKERGCPVYVYKASTSTVMEPLYMFESKTYMYKELGIHHKSLNFCLDTGSLYLNYFLFSLDVITEVKQHFEPSLDLGALQALVKAKRNLYTITYPSAKQVSAELVENGKSQKTIQAPSLNSLAASLGGDRQTIRSYLKGERKGLYRGKWKLTYTYSAT